MKAEHVRGKKLDEEKFFFCTANLAQNSPFERFLTFSLGAFSWGRFLKVDQSVICTLYKSQRAVFFKEV
jgi:hypothetical protein